MAELYPTNMPLPLITGYTQGSANQVEQVDVEIGAPRFEFKVDTVNMPVKVRWLFDDIQMQVFEGWYFHVLDSGTKSFDMDLIVGGGAKSHECYFQKPYKIALKNKKWLVTGDLNAVSKQYDDLATYQAARASLLPPAEIGDIYWSMSNPAQNRYAFRSAAYQHARTDTPITLEIGDTVTFRYDSDGGRTAVSYFIHSSTGADNVGYAGHDASGDLILSNFTATMDGDPIVQGDPIYKNSVLTDMKFHTVTLTATARTDFQHIGSMGDGDLGGSGNAGTGNIVFALFDFTVVTSGQTYVWPMNTYNTASQVESNATGNDVTINNHQTSRWVTVNIEENQAVDIDWHLRTSDPNSGDNITSQTASLRSDGAGYSLGFLASAEYMRALEDAWTTSGDLSYQNGFTIEVLCRYRGSANSTSRACGIVNSFNNASITSLWLIGFDNFDDVTNANSVRPCFTLISRGTIYSNFNSYSNVESEVRDTNDAVIDNIYHLVGTIRPSDDTIEFWVNGVSIGTASIDPSWYGSLGTDSVLDGSQATYIGIGPRYLNGAWRSNQLSEIQDIKIHLLEADQAFVDGQMVGIF